MTRSYLYLINHAHSMSQFRNNPDPELLVQRLGTASSGEGVLIRAALSLVPSEWLPDSAKGVEFRLSDVAMDSGNTRALLEAIAIEAGHPDLLDGGSW